MVLTLPESTKVFCMYCDAYQVGLGCVIMQHGKVIVYASKKLKVHDRNYPTHGIEFEAMVNSLNIWRNYLYGVHVYVYSFMQVSNICLLKWS